MSEQLSDARQSVMDRWLSISTTMPSCGHGYREGSVAYCEPCFWVMLAKLAAPQWQPIETAPKDGTRILIYQPDGQWKSRRDRRLEYIDVAYWHTPGNPEHPGFWTGGLTYRPTHWMPLPEPPR